MAGNKNSGRKPKAASSSGVVQSKRSSRTRSPDTVIKDKKVKQTLAKATPLSPKRTQTKIDHHFKKSATVTTPLPARRGRPPKDRSVVVTSPLKRTTSTKPKEDETKRQKISSSESRQFSCSYCNQAFTRKYDMEKHSRKVANSMIYLNL